MIFNVAEAKANLSKLINMAFHGEEVVIAKNNLPLVELVKHKPKSKIVFGLLTENGAIDADEYLIEEDEEINELFYSSKIEPK
jgi:prevent-host-death family protein